MGYFLKNVKKIKWSIFNVFLMFDVKNYFLNFYYYFNIFLNKNYLK